MNKPTRTEIQNIINQLEELKDLIDNLQYEEQEKYDNLPEGLQSSERGEAMQEAADNLESAVSSLEETIDYLSSAIE